MNDDNLDIFVKISTQLGELNGSIKAVLSKLADHETRLNTLEQKKTSDFREQLLMLLAKTLVIGAVVVAGLTGVGGIIKGIFS